MPTLAPGSAGWRAACAAPPHETSDARQSLDCVIEGEPASRSSCWNRFVGPARLAGSCAAEQPPLLGPVGFAQMLLHPEPQVLRPHLLQARLRLLRLHRRAAHQ